MQILDQKNDQDTLNVFEPLHEGAVVFHYSEAQKAIKSHARMLITDTASSTVGIGSVTIKNIAQEDFSKVRDTHALEEIENIRMHGAEELADAFEMQVSEEKDYYLSYVNKKIAEYQSILPTCSKKTQSQINAFIKRARIVNPAIEKIHRDDFLSRINTVVHSKTGDVEHHIDFSDPVRFRSLIGLSNSDYELLPPRVKILVDNFQKCMNVYFDNFKTSQENAGEKIGLSLVSNVR